MKGRFTENRKGVRHLEISKCRKPIPLFGLKENRQKMVFLESGRSWAIRRGCQGRNCCGGGTPRARTGRGTQPLISWPLQSLEKSASHWPQSNRDEVEGSLAGAMGRVQSPGGTEKGIKGRIWGRKKLLKKKKTQWGLFLDFYKLRYLLRYFCLLSDTAKGAI